MSYISNISNRVGFGENHLSIFNVDYTKEDYDDYTGDGAFGLNCSDILEMFNNNTGVMNLYDTEYFTVFAYAIICAVGLIGNGLVLFVIFGGKETTKTVANIYIWNLALADILLMLCLPFMCAQRFLSTWPFGEALCKIVNAIKFQNYFASIFFLTAMSVDRYVAVVYVVTSVKYRTSRNTFLVCSAIWILSLAMVVPVFMHMYIDPTGVCILNFKDDTGWEVYENTSYLSDFTYTSEECKQILDYMYGEPILTQTTYDYDYYNNGSNGLPNLPLSEQDLINSFLNRTDEEYFCSHVNHGFFRTYIYFIFVSGFVIPFTIITLCYTFIVMKILKPTEMKTRSLQAERKRRKVTRMVIAMVLCFFFCWLPNYVFHMIKMKGITLNMMHCNLIRDITFILAFANSCFNPILYTFLGHNFRERLRRSMTITLRSLTLSTFTKYTSNNHTTSRAETHHPSCKRAEPNIYESHERPKNKTLPYKKVEEADLDQRLIDEN